MVEKKNESALYGDEVHQHFKAYFKSGTPLPLHLRHYEPSLARIRNAPGTRIVEQQIALNDKFEQVEWYAKDAYLRVISDLVQHNGKSAINWDWKTGKPYDDFTQLKLTAAVLFHLGQEIEEITNAYYWLKTKKVAAEKMKRADTVAFWTDLMPRVQKYQAAHDAQDFPPRPGKHCDWCQVKTCQYWQAKK